GGALEARHGFANPFTRITMRILSGVDRLRKDGPKELLMHAFSRGQIVGTEGMHSIYRPGGPRSYRDLNVNNIRNGPLVRRHRSHTRHRQRCNLTQTETS